MSNRQSQKSGHSSVNIQGQEVSIGLGYSEVRQVFMDLFEVNFHKLRSEAAEIARERAESFVNSFIEEAAREGQAELPEAENLTSSTCSSLLRGSTPVLVTRI